MNKVDILKELKWRGIISNITDEEKFKTICDIKDVAVYVGFDPTYHSLHLGNYVMMRILKMFKRFGFKTVALIGGATGMIGDPSGKAAERKLLNHKTILKNIESIKKQLEALVNPDYIFNNYEIWSSMNVIDYLRDIGKLFNVNVMLEKDIVRNRLESGISYTEFSYSILQSYDWIKLKEKFNVHIQLGGSDQWGNITAGTNLFRKIEGEEGNVCGITINLLTKSDGTKFGKSEGGALYLDKNETSPYDLYQFLINQRDDDLEKLFKFFTDLNESEIENILAFHKVNPKDRIGQKKLCENIMRDIHGEKSFDDAQRISKLLFEEKYFDLSEQELLDAFKSVDNYTVNDKSSKISDILVDSKFFKSKREVRDLISQNGLSYNGKKITNEEININDMNLIHNKYIVLKKGKKSFYLIMVK